MFYKTGQKVITLVEKPDYPSLSEGVINSFNESNVLIEFSNTQKGKTDPITYKFSGIRPADELLVVDLRTHNDTFSE